jgi:hypothetical protein
MLTQRTRIIGSDQQWKMVILSIIIMPYLSSIVYSIKDKLGGDNNCGLFAVFDGHGGKQVADHC